MQNLGLLNVKEVHSFGNVDCHPESLFHGQLDLFFLMKKREKGATKTEFCQNQNMATRVICASSHKIDQIGVSDLDKSCNFSLKLLRQVIFARVLAIVLELQFFDGNIVLLVSCFEDVCTCTRANLFFKKDVLNVNPKVVLRSHELLAQDVTSLLSLCFSGTVRLSQHIGSLPVTLFVQILRAFFRLLGLLQLFFLAHEHLVLLT